MTTVASPAVASFVQAKFAVNEAAEERWSAIRPTKMTACKSMTAGERLLQTKPILLTTIAA